MSDHSITDAGVTIRRLWLADFADLRNHLKRLDSEARHERFGHAVSDAFIDGYVDTAHRLGTVIFGAYADGELRAIAELRTVAGALPAAAEGALTVEKAFQGRGIGKALMARMVEAAQARGYPSLYMVCLKDNGRMRHIAKSAGAVLHYDAGDVTGYFSPPPASPTSVIAEYLHEGSDFIMAFFDHAAPALGMGRR